MLTRWISSNLGVLVTLVVLCGSGIAGYATLTGDVRKLEEQRAERVKLVDGQLAEIKAIVAQMPNLVYRVAAGEEGLKATNQRVDLSLSNVSARLAELNQTMGALQTQVAVLTQQLQQALPQRRAEALPGQR